ncbi:MAG TPA: alkaline phosphatase family protein, partial [Polyangiaceae bacterium]
GESHERRKRPEGAAKSSPSHAPMLVIALDGIDRELLYGMLRKGELPALAGLLGGGGSFPHAYFEESLEATLPSTTMAAWSTAFTGVTPAHHGIAGNEFFVREERRLAAPAPASFDDHDPVLAIYTDQYLNRLLRAPTVYERMRRFDPNVLVWVAMQQVYGGADKLLVTRPAVVVEAFEAFVEEVATKIASNRESRVTYAKLDEDAAAVVVSALDAKVLPDVLTVYFAGTDLYAHVAKEGPDVARRAYLREVVDPALGRIADKLRARHALEDRFVIVTSDHGHTEVLRDDTHALSPDATAATLTKAGFRVRPFKLDVAKDDDFSAVVAYGGALAYVYVADRSTCAHEKIPCDWMKPPRFEEDVIPAADAFFKAGGETLDMVLTRRPRPYAEEDLPFEVYVGDGKLVPVETWLAQHPHPTYVDLAARLRDLAVGPFGERAGDVLLVAHDGDRDTPADRYYFAAPYHSWHGSPSHRDSDIPLVVANARRPRADVAAIARAALGEHPSQAKITDLMLAIRHLPH